VHTYRTIDDSARRAALALVITCIAAAEAQGQPVLNEFLFRDGDSRLEFIEILNRGDDAIDLFEYGISDDRRMRIPLAEVSQPLPSGAYAVFVRDSTAFDARFQSPRSRPRSWPTLNNDGDSILLYHFDRVIDSVSFDAGWGEIGRSMERLDPNGPSLSKANWQSSLDPSGATPARRNSVFQPDRTPPELVEAEEWTDGSVSLYASEPLHPEVLEKVVIRFASGDRPRAARLDPTGTRISVEPWSGADLDAVTVDGLVDAAGNVAMRQGMRVARQPKAGELQINEILFEPASDPYDGLPDQAEFIELNSTASHPIALRGVYLTGRTSETGDGDTLRAEASLRIHSSGHALYVAAGASNDSFTSAFPSTPPESLAARVAIPRSSLGLNNSGDTVHLYSVDDRPLDEVAYDRTWHLAELSETRGRSLERISASGASNDAANWTSSVDPEGATPGRVNSVVVTGEAGANGISVEPSPFSPDADGFEDFALIAIETGRPIGSAAVWIFDAAGRLRRRIADALPVGSATTFVWDGRDDAGSMLPTGVYIAYAEVVHTTDGDVQTFKTPVVVYHAR